MDSVLAEEPEVFGFNLACNSAKAAIGNKLEKSQQAQNKDNDNNPKTAAKLSPVAQGS